MIFKTFNNDIDKWTAKIGIFGKSFNELGTAIKNALWTSRNEVNNFGEEISFWDALKNNLLPKKEDITSQLIDVMPEINTDNLVDATEKIKNLSKDVANGTTTWQELFDTLPEGQKHFAQLGQQMEGQIITTEGVAKANQSARDAALAHNAALKQQTLGAKAASVVMKGLATVGNMFLGVAISWGISKIVEGIDSLITTSEEYLEQQSEIITKSDEIISSTQSEIDALEGLSEKLKATNGDMTEMLTLSEEINNVLGEGSSSILNQANAYDILNAKIERNIELNKQEQEKANAEKKEALKNSIEKAEISNSGMGSDLTLQDLGASSADYDTKTIDTYFKELLNEAKENGEIIDSVEEYSALWRQAAEKMQSDGSYLFLPDSDKNWLTYSIPSEEELQEYFNTVLPNLYEYFENEISNSGSFFASGDIKNMVRDMYLQGFGIEGIQKTLNDLLSNNELQELWNNFSTAFYNNDSNQNNLYDAFIKEIDGIKESYPYLSTTIDDYVNYLYSLLSRKTDSGNNTTSFSDAFNSSDFSEQKEELLDLAKAGELTPETLESTEEYTTLLTQTGLSADLVKDKIYELITAQEKLAGAHNGLDDLSNSYKEFKDLGFVTAQTLEGLPDVFKSLEGFDVFSQIVGNPESGVDAIQNAFNNIVKEYLLFTQTLNSDSLFGDNIEEQERAINTYIANLKQMGITNAEEVVNQTVSSMKQQQTLLDNAEQEYIDYLRGNEEDYMGYLKAKNNIDLQYIESTASYNSQFINSLGQGYETDYNNWLGLLRDKELAYQRYVKSLDGDGDGKFIYDPNKDVAGNLIANGKDASASNIVDFYTAKAEYERISKKYEDLRNTLSFNPVFSNNFSANWDGSSLSSGSGSKNSDNEFDWIETKLDILNDKLEKTKETAQDSFSDWIDRDKAFKDADKQIDDLIAKQKEAKARYLAEARKVGLTKKDENGISYTTLIQQGAIDIDKISNDTLKEKIQSYQEYWDKVKECDEAVVQLNKDSLQLDRDYREFKWEIFDYLQDSISRLTDEADYLIELLSNKDLFDNNGNLTKYADATLGLHISNYKTYMQKASDYAEEIKDLEKQLANGGQEVLDKYNERIDAHQDAILAAQQEKQAMLDLVEQGYQKQLDALNEAIDKKKELWNIEKGLFDYQQSIAEKTKNIAILEKRKFALSGDSSQEAKAQLQQIEVELSEARKDLEQTEYEKMISDQEQMLDQLSSDYEEWINQRIDNSDSLLQQIINNLSADGEISKTLKEIAGSYGTNISKDLLTSVSGNTNNAINNLVNNISKLLGGNTTLIGNVGGYASGTTSATKGLHWFNENGNEIIIRKADGAVLGNFDQGDVVISNEGAKLLSAFSQDPTAFMEKFGFSNYIQPMVNVNIPKIPNIERFSNQTPINNTTHMEVILPNVTNYDDFMNRMQNDKRFDNIVTASMNSKMTGGNSLSKFRF